MFYSQSKVGSRDRKHEEQKDRINQKIKEPATYI